MDSLSFIVLFTPSILCCSFLIHAQQLYVGKATTGCANPDTSNSVLGYKCNGLNRSCKAYLTFRSQSSYNTVASMSTLFSSHPSQLAELNSVPKNATFETNKPVIVPVICSCSSAYYQANTYYTVRHTDTYFLIANNVFQGLSTCQALRNQNGKSTKNLYSGTKIMVPLRCACPTKNQSDLGVNYLLSYVVTKGDYVSSISQRFGADTEKTLEANELSEQYSTIYPFTTLLVPLQNPPSSSQTINPPPPPSPASPTLQSSNTLPTKSSDKTWIYIVVGILVGTAVVLVSSALIFCTFFRKGKKSDSIIVSGSFEACEKSPKKNLDDESQDILDSIDRIAGSLQVKVYKYEELQSATDDFSPSCWIKGSVYRGIINGDFAAIKKVNGDVSNEITLLNKINHFNLIRLSGVSFKDGYWYLVYEYAVNGPLSDWIYHNNSDGKHLNWRQRMQIALDIATGLNCLHSFTTPPHVHKDIRSSNALLDSDFRAKIANFRLARSAEGQEGQFALTRHIVGTKGYVAPEYLENGLVSTKLDVYAFGVLMLEMITGKEAAVLFGEESMNVSDFLSSAFHQEDTLESLRHLIDPTMQENYPPELAILMVRLINSCMEKDPSSRPAMNGIVQSLSRILMTSLTWEATNNILGQ